MGLRIEKYYWTGAPVAWIAPPGVVRVLVFIIGGGGGGGGGMSGDNTTTRSPSGGGGGGGAIEISSWIDVIPGRQYNLFVAIGGDGGNGGLVPTAGTDGGDSYVQDNVTTNYNIYARGAQGGEGGKNGAIAFGGMPCKVPSLPVGFRPTLGADGLGTIYPGFGGWGSGRGNSPTTAWPGAPGIRGGFSITGQGAPFLEGGFSYPVAGVIQYGNGNPQAANSGSYAGGGGGGGGGCATICSVDTFDGSENTGGGPGGAGNNAGVGFPGSAWGGPGQPRAVGHGGGGGGAGGCGSSGGGAGSNGTYGGNGRIVLIYMPA